MKSIALVAREMGGWAEAGGVKDVVKDQARALVRLGWDTHVVLPLYGYLAPRVRAQGALVWKGRLAHPSLVAATEAWRVTEGGVSIHFLSTPALADKNAPYTYTDADQAAGRIRGQGFVDWAQVNLEFQWAVASYWAHTMAPPLVLGHDGHLGFLPAILKTHPEFGHRFRETHLGLLIHNAGQGYRQEMAASAAHDRLLGLSEAPRKAALLEGGYDPMVSASHHARLATVSENYADELISGRNDHWSGPFGRWLRASKTPLEGITNGLSTDDKDPRDPVSAGLPAGFDPLKGDWEGKAVCRDRLRSLVHSGWSAVHGAFDTWDGPLYVMQGRLTAQKGVDALVELLNRAFREPGGHFLIMAQGEHRYETSLIHLAEAKGRGRLIFINAFEETAARLVFAAGDFFLMPSEYEPCGLTDLKAQLMANLPIVHAVGGLVKIHDGVTGFTYEKHRHGGLWGAFQRSLRVYANPEELHRLRRQAFSSALDDYHWETILQERYLPWLEGGRLEAPVDRPREVFYPSSHSPT